MSDLGRKDMTSKVSESITPDESKSTAQKAKESITDAGDKIAKQVQTDDSKSTTQAAADHIGTTKDNTGSTLDSTQNDTSAGSGSIIDSVKHAVGMDGSTKQ